MAILELVAGLGFPKSFARIWVAHRGKAKPMYPGLKLDGYRVYRYKLLA